MSEVMNAPGGWEVDIIESLAEIITGDKDTQDKLEDGKYPFYVRSNTVEHINTYSFDGEAILTAGDGVGVGKVFHHVNEKFDFHQRVYCIFNFSERLNPKYFFEYFRKNFIKRVNKYSAKGSVDSVRYEMISLMEIPVPPIKEQQKIAKILSTIDQAIEATQKLIAKEKNIKKGLMHDLLSNGIDENGKIRTPKTHRYKESELGLIPEEWEVNFIQSILTIQYGKNQKDVEVINGKYPILGTGGIMGFTNHFLYDKPSVLIGRKGTINRPQYMETPFWTVDTLFYSKIKEQHSPKWAFYIFESINWNKYNEASGVPSLSTANINRIKIKKPSYQEQKQIANILTIQDKKIETEEKNLAKLKELKKGLMDDLLSGSVRVKL